jgi:hypothetical protein
MSERKPEQKFRDYVRDIMHGYWHYEWHEDRYSSDIPDLSYAIGGVCGWIEFKVIKKFPKFPRRTVIKIPKLTVGQRRWLKGRRDFSPNVYLMVKVEDPVRYYIFNTWEAFRQIGITWTQERWETEAEAVWSESILSYQLRGVLIKRER